MRPGAPPPASVEVDVVPLTHIFFLSPEKLMPDVMKLFDAGVEAMGMKGPECNPQAKEQLRVMS